MNPTRPNTTGKALVVGRPIYSPPALPLSDVLNLGTLDPLSVSENDALGKAVAELVRRARGGAGDNRAGLSPLPFHDYCTAVRNMDKLRRAYHQLANSDRAVYIPEPHDSPELRRLVGRLFNSQRHTPDFVGYVNYVGGINDFLQSRLQRVLASVGAHRLTEKADRQAHTLITGGSRSGKSELLKQLIHHYVRNPQLGGVLVIDPHNDMATQIARWREFAGDGADRLVYLDANAHPEMVPKLNPLRHDGVSEKEIVIMADELANALAYFGGEGESQSGAMQRVGKLMLRVMLTANSGTARDLSRALTPRGPKAPHPLTVLGRKHHDEEVSEFFSIQFDGAGYATTREALKRRLSNALENPDFREMITAPEPLNLEALLSAGKVVVVNCASVGAQSAVHTLGRLLMAQMVALGVRRRGNPALPRSPIHVFVDEATELMAPPFVKVLEGLAKTGIFLTMAQQGAGEGAERDLVNRVKRSTFLKFIGRTGYIGEILKMVQVERSKIPHLEQGQFIVTKTGEENAPMVLTTARNLADNANAMGTDEWAAVLQAQLAAYYRPLTVALPKPSTSPAGEKSKGYWLP